MKEPAEYIGPEAGTLRKFEGSVNDISDGPRSDTATQVRLKSLLRANLAVLEQPDLPGMLQRIADAALELVDAEYAALGVIDPVHGGLEQFIYKGISPNLAKRIGHLPEGHGLLGALIDDPRPIRLDHLSEDARRIGFPKHHPPMDSFLGVPIRIHDEVFGNLYLTNQNGTGSFSAEDEQLVESLAATAGFAIENARLLNENLRRQRWSAVTAEILAALLSADQRDPIALIADRVLEVAGAAHVRVVVPTEDIDKLSIRIARGLSPEIEGTLIPAAGSLAGSVLEGMNPRLIDGGAVSQMRPLLPEGDPPNSVIAVPMIADGRARGVLLAVRGSGTPRFTATELEMVADFASQATLAMELADARAAQQRIAVFEDRARIARDLHDHVIQQLFASGLELQSLIGTFPDADGIQRVGAVVANLDNAIAKIRTIIFALSSTGEGHGSSLRHQIIDLVGEFDGGLVRTPTVTFAGPVDLMVTGKLTNDVLAVVREALANIAKHSRAHSAAVALTVENGLLKVEVEDDGVGMSPNGRRSGLANLELRATQRGGSFALKAGQTGTRLQWHIPLDLLRDSRGL